MMMSNDYIDVNLVCKQISGVFLCVFLTIFIFYQPGKHGKHFLAGQIPKSFLKKFGKRQLFQTYKQRAQIDIAVNFI